MESNNTEYYKPNIEEFHIGFEYELFDGIKWLEQEYGKFPFTHPQTFIDNNHCRVRKLSETDFENSGFKFLKKGWGDDSKIYRNNRGFGSEIYYRGLGNCTITLHGGYVLFHGDLKNKSELNKILKQVRINE